MSASVTFTVPGSPQPKGRPRLGRYGRVRTPSATKAYEHKVAVYARKARIRRRPGRFAVTIGFYFGDHRRRDIDNAAKAVLDALNGIAWDDDSQVVHLTASSSVDADNPRAEITLELLPSSSPLPTDSPTSPSPGEGHVHEAGPSPTTRHSGG